MKLMKECVEKGFSLIEIMAVIAIMGIMGVIIAPRYASNKNAKALSYAKTQITNDIRYVQNYTFSTKRMPDGSSPTGGFGIHFKEGTQYVIFGDKAGTGAVNQRYDGGGELFETVNLVDGVRISNLRIRKGAVWSDVPESAGVDFVSQPPYGKIFIDGEKNEDYAGGIELEITYTNSASNSGIIILTGAGLIK
jgi:prepilin-type N-terminal cleavage/methylation domain-containing protein